ncbi:hypothetical protein SLE2022_216360 [Rubroshorea leprosula]
MHVALKKSGFQKGKVNQAGRERKEHSKRGTIPHTLSLDYTSPHILCPLTSVSPSPFPLSELDFPRCSNLSLRRSRELPPSAVHEILILPTGFL